ncbi:MAG: hypothetical protein DRI79_06020, partial [Chloroflexi bacterium]
GAGFGDRGHGAESDDDAVEPPGAEGDDDEGPHRQAALQFVRQVISESRRGHARGRWFDRR